MFFTIDDDNNITVYERPEEFAAGGNPVFVTQKELGTLAEGWPSTRLAEIWNSLPGVKPTKNFTTRAAGVKRIWDRVQGLVPAPGARNVASKAPKSRKKATPPSARETKADMVIGMMRAKGGATIEKIMKAADWQRHTVRGFVAGYCARKGLKVKSTKAENGSRTYSI